MSTVEALVLTEKAGPDALDRLQVASIPKPQPGPSQLLVKVAFTAINPVDWKMAEYGFLIKGFPVVFGCDAAGVVEAVGESVKDFKVGDQVYGYPDLGTGFGSFSQYTILDSAAANIIPAGLSPAQASSLAVGSLTAYLSVFPEGRPGPSQAGDTNKGKQILIWGAAGSVGTYAVQLAAAAGYDVIAVSSAKTAEYVKSLGASAVADYNSPTLVDDIKKLLTGPLTIAADFVGSATATIIASQLLASDQPAVIATIAGVPTNPPANVKPLDVLLGVAYQVPAVLAQVAVANKEIAALFAQGKFKPNAIEVVGKGFPAIVTALKQSKAGVSAKKLVVEL